MSITFKHKMVWLKNKYLLLLLPFWLHSCSICSHSSSKVSDAETSIIGDVRSQSKLAPQHSLLTVGYPVISDTISSQILNRICYTLSYNSKTRQPNWVMWKLMGEHIMSRQEGVWNEYHEDMNMEEVLLLLTNGETCSLVEQHRMQMRFVQQSLTVRTFPALVIMDMLAVIMPTFFFPSLL